MLILSKFGLFVINYSIYEENWTKWNFENLYDFYLNLGFGNYFSKRRFDVKYWNFN